MSSYPMNHSRLRLLQFVAVVLLATACASSNRTKWKNEETAKELTAELEKSSRPKADRDRDADRKPAQLMAFFGVERGMTVADLISGGGYMTEVMSVVVGPDGKVYSQNPIAVPAMTERLAGNRLPNVARVQGTFTSLPADSLDVAITVMNLHDVVNASGAKAAQSTLAGLYPLLKREGVLGVVDHVGIEGANNAALHRMTKKQAIEVVTAAGFVLDSESDLLASATDDHTKRVDDPAIRGKTDQFVLKFRKGKK